MYQVLNKLVVHVLIKDVSVVLLKMIIGLFDVLRIYFEFLAHGFDETFHVHAPYLFIFNVNLTALRHDLILLEVLPIILLNFLQRLITYTSELTQLLIKNTLKLLSNIIISLELGYISFFAKHLLYPFLDLWEFTDLVDVYSVFWVNS